MAEPEDDGAALRRRHPHHQLPPEDDLRGQRAGGEHSYPAFSDNCHRRQDLRHEALQPLGHHRRRLQGQLRARGAVPQVGHACASSPRCRTSCIGRSMGRPPPRSSSTAPTRTSSTWGSTRGPPHRTESSRRSMWWSRSRVAVLVGDELRCLSYSVDFRSPPLARFKQRTSVDNPSRDHRSRARPRGI